MVRKRSSCVITLARCFYYCVFQYQLYTVLQAYGRLIQINTTVFSSRQRYPVVFEAPHCLQSLLAYALNRWQYVPNAVASDEHALMLQMTGRFSGSRLGLKATRIRASESCLLSTGEVSAAFFQVTKYCNRHIRRIRTAGHCLVTAVAVVLVLSLAYFLTYAYVDLHDTDGAPLAHQVAKYL